MSNPLETVALSGPVEQSETVELALVRRAREGDVDAFSELVRAYQRRAVSLAYRLLGNAEDASDVSQDAFVRAFRSLGQLEDASRFGPWLLRVVSNLSLNFRRARRSRPATSLDDLGGAEVSARSPGSRQRIGGGQPDGEGALPEELHVAIDAAMRQLPDKQRLALILFSVEGMPQKDVAEVMECSVELVKWNVFQARKKLRELLAEHIQAD